MELATIFLAMFKPLLWALPIFLLGAFLKSPMFKGWVGERRVRNLIRRRLDPSVYREFHNVTIRTERGETTQIDHIYVSPFGVLVIETKNMGHWIWGDRTRRTWTQQIYRKKIAFQNPLHQNHGHVKALEALLDIPERVFKPIVVFVGDSTFKTEMPDEVCTYEDLIGYIRSIDTRILSEVEIDGICNSIQALRLEPSWQVHRGHVDSLRRRHGEPSVAARGLPRDLAHDFVEAAGERLLRAAEDRIRSGGRRSMSRGVQLGLGAMVAKGLLAIVAMLMIWWAFASALATVDQMVRAPLAVPVTRAPEPGPVLAPQAPVVSTAVIDYAPQPEYRQPTAEEIAESQRKADEAMRVLAPSTPEVPLTLPRAAQ